MEVFVLGTGVGVPNLNRSYPGIFVKCNKGATLIDPGPGSLRQLLKSGFTYQDVDSIVITHFHPDHCLDLVSFLFACRYPVSPRKKPVTLIGPEGIRDLYNGLAEIFKDAVKVEGFKLDVIETMEGSFLPGGAKVKVKRVEHTRNSVGIRLSCPEGGVLAYSGDTGYCRSVIDLAFGADLLIIESSFPEGTDVKTHLTPSLAGRIARESGAKKVVLTHLYPVCEGHDILSQCKREYKGPVSIASDLMKIKI